MTIARLPGATTINNYGDGPVIQGNGAQVAYGNQHVTQVCAAGSGLRTQALIEAVTAVLNVLPNIGLSADEHAETSQAAHDVLSEARKEQPDAGRLRKTVAQLKGYLAPLAVSLASGAAHGVGDGAEQATRQAIESLINARW